MGFPGAKIMPQVPASVALCLLVVLSGSAVRRLVAAWSRGIKNREMQRLADRRRAHRDRKAQESLRPLPAAGAGEEQAIYRLTAGQIAAKVQKGELSAATVLSIFALRAHEFGLGGGLNCVTEELYEEALALARAIDSGLSDHDAGAAGGGRSAAEDAPLPLSAASSGATSVEEEDEEGGPEERVTPAAGRLLGLSTGGIAPPGPRAWADGLPPQRRRRRQGRVLEGVPISVKDCIDVRGTDTTCGMAARCFQPASEDALAIRLLKEAGAVPFVKTNVPQGMVSFETINNIYGRTLNPWNLERTPGGSSGGGSALLACRGTPLSIGTDIGGSIRIPCAFGGLYGFKTTTDRVSKKGLGTPRRGNVNGQTAIRVAVGPMATCVDDLALVLEAWWGTPRMWQEDPYVTPKLFEESAYLQGKGRPLRVGRITSDGHFEPCAAVRRALDEAAVALERAGHEVVATELPCDSWAVVALYYRIMGADGNMHCMQEALEGEAFCEIYQGVKMMSAMPSWLRSLLCKVGCLLGERRLANPNRAIRSGGANVRDYWAACAQLVQLRTAFVDFMKEQRLDALILPSSPLPAFHHGTPLMMLSTAVTSFLPNMLGWPAGVVPMTTVRPGEDDYDIASLPPIQRDSFARLAQQQCRGSVGLPVAVQILTLHNEDELNLHIMAAIERFAPFHQVPPAYDVPVGEGEGRGGDKRGGGQKSSE